MDSFLSFLFQKISKGFYPQIVYSNGYISWYPGNKKINKIVLPKNPNLIGFSGRCYQDYLQFQHQQSYEICWCGIDIDDYIDYQWIQQRVPECTIRQSKSHEGLHLFFRFENPVKIEKGIKGSIIKESLKPFIKSLEKIEDKICKWDGNIFWIGCKNVEQKILYQSDKFIEYIESKEIKTYQELKSIGGYKGKLSKNGQRFITFLRRKGLIGKKKVPIKQEIYIKRWFEILQKTQYRFFTKSPMKSLQPHGNGFFIVENGNFQIYSNIDNRIIFERQIGLERR